MEVQVKLNLDSYCPTLCGPTEQSTCALDAACGATLSEADGCNAGGVGMQCRWCGAADVDRTTPAVGDVEEAVSRKCPAVQEKMKALLQESLSALADDEQAAGGQSSRMQMGTEVAVLTRFEVVAHGAGPELLAELQASSQLALCETVDPTRCVVRLASALPSKAPKECVAFGAPMLDTDMFASLIGDPLGAADAIGDCCKHCELNVNCAGFTEYQGNCYFKTEPFVTSSLGGRVTYLRRPRPICEPSCEREFDNCIASGAGYVGCLEELAFGTGPLSSRCTLGCQPTGAMRAHGPLCAPSCEQEWADCVVFGSGYADCVEELLLGVGPLMSRCTMGCTLTTGMEAHAPRRLSTGCTAVAAPTCAGPTELCFHDPTCSNVGGMGCDAGGHNGCRFCGFGPYVACPVSSPPTAPPAMPPALPPPPLPSPSTPPVSPPPSSPGCSAMAAPTCAGATELCFHDPTCASTVGGIGCGAGGHNGCRFCGFGPYVACPVSSPPTAPLTHSPPPSQPPVPPPAVPPPFLPPLPPAPLPSPRPTLVQFTLERTGLSRSEMLRADLAFANASVGAAITSAMVERNPMSMLGAWLEFNSTSIDTALAARASMVMMGASAASSSASSGAQVEAADKAATDCVRHADPT